MKPYFKLLALILASSLIINLQGPSLQVICFSFLALVLGRKIWARLKFLALPLILIAGLQILFNHTLAGVIAAIKIANLSLLVLIYTNSASPKEISQVFSWLPADLRLTLSIALNLIPIIFQEAQKIQLVQVSRGRKFKSPLPIVIPLLHRSLKRAEQLAIVLAVGKRGVEPPRA